MQCTDSQNEYILILFMDACYCRIKARGALRENNPDVSLMLDIYN